MAIKRYNTEINEVKYSFGLLALSQFNIATGSSDDIRSVHAAFQGATKIKAILEMIKGGYAQAYGKLLTDQQAADLAEAMTLEQQSALMDAFMSSIVGEDFNEWMIKLQAELDALEAAEQATTLAATQPSTEPAPAEAAPTDESPNDGAPSSDGAKSKNSRAKSA